MRAFLIHKKKKHEAYQTSTMCHPCQDPNSNKPTLNIYTLMGQPRKFKHWLDI